MILSNMKVTVRSHFMYFICTRYLPVFFALSYNCIKLYFTNIEIIIVTLSSFIFKASYIYELKVNHNSPNSFTIVFRKRTLKPSLRIAKTTSIIYCTLFSVAESWRILRRLSNTAGDKKQRMISKIYPKTSYQNNKIKIYLVPFIPLGDISVSFCPTSFKKLI